MLNSIDADGTKAGYDIEITHRISENVGVPVVASGGAGNLDHVVDVLKQGQVMPSLPPVFSTLANTRGRREKAPSAS